MIEELTLVRPDAVLVGETTGGGQEVLLLHAGGESRAVWRPIMAMLAGRGIRAVAFDQRGHGESGGSPAEGVRAYGDDAKAMISKMRWPVAVGASLGGFALMLALEEMEANVAGLVLVDVTPAPNPVRTRAYLAPRGALGASPLVEDILSQTEHFARIVAALRLPILLVCGGPHSPIGDDGRAHFSALAPHARVEIVANAGHLVARDAPDQLAQLIGDFAESDSVAMRGSADPETVAHEAAPASPISSSSRTP